MTKETLVNLSNILSPIAAQVARLPALKRDALHAPRRQTIDGPATPRQFKARLRAQGKTIGQWADENGFKRLDVYRVLNGVYKAHYGAAHDIAVKAGLKADPTQLAA